MSKLTLTIIALYAGTPTGATTCVDDPLWEKQNGKPGKTCAWIAWRVESKPKICQTAKSSDGTRAKDACPLACGTCPACDVSEVRLSDFEAWRREEGFWWGKYTFLDENGDPYESSTWNYEYQHYWGFIHMELVGNSLKQRNVFVYPPSQKCAADNSTSGEGVCGVNGNEKVFSADQSASDCDGNLAGPYPYGPFTLDTTTTLFGDDTIVYQVKLPAALGGGFTQNQLTTLPGNDVRVRTAQGFYMGAPTYASFYREYRLADKAAWLTKLAEIRGEAGVLPSDECGFDSRSAPSGVTCAEHFGFDM